MYFGTKQSVPGVEAPLFCPNLPVCLWRTGLTQEAAASCICAAKTQRRCFPIQFTALTGHCSACTRLLAHFCYLLRSCCGHGHNIAASVSDDSSNWAKALKHLCMVFFFNFFLLSQHTLSINTLYATSSAIWFFSCLRDKLDFKINETTPLFTKPVGRILPVFPVRSSAQLCSQGNRSRTICHIDKCDFMLA